MLCVALSAITRVFSIATRERWLPRNFEFPAVEMKRGTLRVTILKIAGKWLSPIFGPLIHVLTTSIAWRCRRLNARRDRLGLRGAYLESRRFSKYAWCCVYVRTISCRETSPRDETFGVAIVYGKASFVRLLVAVAFVGVVKW